MTTRERYIKAGIIKPAGTTAERSVRSTLIEQGIVRPAPEGMTMPQIMREFLLRWYSKPSRRWESPRNRDGVWS
jgi:hypothetical protein